jgi:putative membrane protein
MEFPGIDGFLGTRASVMLDVVFLAMFAVVPLLAWGVWLARRGRWQLHKQVQVTLATILLLAVVAFEVDMQWLTEWELRAQPSPYFDLQQKWTSPAGLALLVHLAFAVPTALVWAYVIFAAFRKFPAPPAPSPHSHSHRRWGWLAAVGMTLTATTGWLFYWLAFVA